MSSTPVPVGSDSPRSPPGEVPEWGAASSKPVADKPTPASGGFESRARLRRSRAPGAPACVLSLCDTVDLACSSLIAPRGPGLLTNTTVGGFAVGTWQNDACAACWFSYLLIFLERTQGLSGTEAGFVLLAGQLADAFSTPVIGTFSDRSRGCAALSLGRRHLFHLVGTLIVACSFTFVFGLCLPCAIAGGPLSIGPAGRTASFAVAAAVFNVGWAAAQVSHLSLVPELTASDEERLLLNSARYVVFVLANIFVFSSASVLVAVVPGGEDNALTFLYLTAAVLSTGLVFSMAFQVLTHNAVEHGGGGTSKAAGAAAGAAVGEGKGDVEQQLFKTRGGGGKSPQDWLRTPVFWRLAFVYLMMRLVVTVSGVYVSFYVTDTLAMPDTAIGVIPLVTFLASLSAAFMLKRVTVSLGARMTLMLGSAFALVACVGFAFIPIALSDLMFVVAIFQGLGNATLTVCVITMISEMLGDDLSSAAFVFGFLSFCDKLTAGVLLLGIQIASDTFPPPPLSVPPLPPSPGRALFFRLVIAVTVSVAAVLCVLVAWTVPVRSAPAKGESGAASDAGESGAASGALSTPRKARGGAVELSPRAASQPSVAVANPLAVVGGGELPGTPSA